MIKVKITDSVFKRAHLNSAQLSHVDNTWAPSFRLYIWDTPSINFGGVKHGCVFNSITTNSDQFFLPKRRGLRTFSGVPNERE